MNSIKEEPWEGKWWDGRDCPECGCKLLHNAFGEVWCSFVECNFETTESLMMDVEKVTEAGVKAGAALVGFVKAMAKDKPRSRLAEVLGVEDDVPFLFRDKTYKIDEHGVLRKQSYYQATGGKHWTNTRATHVCNLINHPEEIHPCPVWSEETIKAAMAAELLGFKEISKSMAGNIDVGWENSLGTYRLHNIQWTFPEIQPGQTVKLSEIK